MRAEGWRALYSGFGAVALASPLASAAYFSSYEAAKKLLVEAGCSERCGAAATYALAGVAAQSVAGVVYTPMDVVKERLQVQAVAARPSRAGVPATTLYSGSGDALQRILRASRAAPSLRAAPPRPGQRCARARARARRLAPG